MKKIISFLMVVGLIVVLVACTGERKEPKTTANKDTLVIGQSMAEI